MGVLNLVHELMHSFGAKHDPDAKENKKCTPDDKVKINLRIKYFKSVYGKTGSSLVHIIMSYILVGKRSLPNVKVFK